MGDHQLQLAFIFSVSIVKSKRARYITQVVNSMLLPCIPHEGDVLFQQDNACPHTAAATQRALRGVQLPGQQDT